MYVRVNGVNLYFDVEGANLVADGPKMRQQPTLIVLHGGPGADHSLYKPLFSQLSDCAQIIYLDHRGNGCSDQSDPQHWNLAQWGDDVRGLCDALGIKKPIVLGTSFGGFVAQAYATQHPDHPSKLVLVSTAAKFDFQKVFEAFEKIGGAGPRQAAENFWLNPTGETRAIYREVCVPLHHTTNMDKNWLARAIIKDDVAIWFNGPHNEQGRMDFRNELSKISCPTLVMAGENDPITPVVFSEEIADSLPSELVVFERFAGCGHDIYGDKPDAFMSSLREFILHKGEAC
ncbi:MAG: alpha/beta fold hydrolase [Hyphomicrobiales bacterium]